MPPEGEAVVIRFRAYNRLIPPAIGRIVTLVALLLGFVPGIWVIAGVIVTRTDPVIVLFGVVFLAVAAFIAWAHLWRYAFEVEVEGDEIRWRGHFRRRSAPLSDLRRVAWSRYLGRVLSFEFHHHGGLELLPGRGVRDFLVRLGELNPGAQIRLPRGLYTSWPPGIYEEAHRPAE